MDIKLEVGCDSKNCTSVSSPGANIATPIATSLIGIIGNTIALVTVHQMKLERQRTVFFVFIAGLAFADLIGKVLTTIPVLLVYTHGSYENVGGTVMCSYHAFTMITMGLLAPMIACAMAIERYLGICHGYFYMRHLNPHRARLCLLSLWLMAISFASLPLLGFGQYAVQYPGTWCFLNIHGFTADDRVDVAYSITFAVLNLIFMIVMIICNIIVQCTLMSMRCQRSSADRADRFRRTHRGPQMGELEVQMVFVLLAITVVFTLCWSPLQIQILMNQFYEHKTATDHVGDLLAVRMASINQLIDPWIYILCKKICFRRGCTCWGSFASRKWGSIRHSFSQRETNGTSSLRSALVRFRTQSTRPTKRCAKCGNKEPPVEVIINEEGGLVVEGFTPNNSFNPVSDSAHYCESSKASSIPAVVVSSSSEQTSSDVPIPIFFSSQYSIQRQRTRPPTRTGARSRRRTASSGRGGRRDNVSTASRREGGEWESGAIRRRHSWCCAGVECVEVTLPSAAGKMERAPN